MIHTLPHLRLVGGCQNPEALTDQTYTKVVHFEKTNRRNTYNAKYNHEVFLSNEQIEAWPCSTSRQTSFLCPPEGRPKGYNCHHPFPPPPPRVIHAISRWEARTRERFNHLGLFIGKWWITRRESDIHPDRNKVQYLLGGRRLRLRTSLAWSKWNVGE